MDNKLIMWKPLQICTVNTPQSPASTAMLCSPCGLSVVVSSVSVNICVVAGSAVSAIRIPGGPEVTRPHLLTRGTRGGSQFGQFSQSLTGHGDAPDGQISGSLCLGH